MSGRKIGSQIIFTVLFIIFMMIAQPAPSDASTKAGDIQGHWAESIIADLMNRGTLSGYEDGTFRPDASINRAEYAALIVKAFGLSGGTDKVFPDTANHWAGNAIATAYQHGIIQGYSEAQFGPDDPVSREQAALMIVRAAGLTNTESLNFIDKDKFSPWAESSIVAAAASGLFSGYPDGSFKPQGRTSRAEAAAVIYKCLNVKAQAIDPEAITEYDKAGVYGPGEKEESITGNVAVKADGVVLQNLHIKGDLIIAEEVGEGNVTLNNITVDGDTMVRGGGKNSIHINGGSFNSIIIQQTSSGAVRIVASNAAGLEVVIAENAAGESIILEGSFAQVHIEAANIELKTQGETSINKVSVAAGAESVKINLDVNTKVENLVLQAAAEIKGAGRIVKAEVKANNVSFEKAPDQQTVDSIVTIPPASSSTSSSGGGDSDSGSSTLFHTLCIIKDGQGTVTPGEGTYRKAQGSKIELSAVPAEGWKFVGWFIYEDEIYSMTFKDPAYEINGIGSNYTLRALFTIEYQGSGSIKDENNEPMEGVTVSLSGEYMETKTTTTDENGWWEAPGLLGDVVVTPSLTGQVFEPVSRTIGWEIPVATFQGRPAEIYTLTINKLGQGTVTPEGTIELEAGSMVRLTAVPADGWMFTGWIINYDPQLPVLQPEEAEYELEVTTNIEVTACFYEESNVSYQLTISKEGEGTVIPAEGAHVLEEGTTVNLAAVPANGWMFTGWTITYTDQTYDRVTAAEYELAINKNQTWKANFAECFTAQGTITASGTPLAGVAITLTRSGDSSEKVYASSDDDGHWSAELRKDSSYYIHMFKYKYTFPSVLIDSSSPNRNFNATYTGNRIIIYGLRQDTEDSGGGSVSRNPDSSAVDDGTVVTFNAQANPGFQFVKWEIKKQNSDGSWEVLSEHAESNPSITVNSPVLATAYFLPMLD